MKTRAAVVHETSKPIQIEELTLDGPRPGEVLVNYHYAGLCHTDVHIAHGDMDAQLPMVLGHEGSGVVVEVGAGVTRVKPGDHVVCSFIPACGVCRYCATGRQSLCDAGAEILTGRLPGDHYPFQSAGGENYGAFCMLGTFSDYGVVHQNSVVPIDRDVPLDVAALVGCGVPTGWGSAVYTARVRPGDTVAVFGAGGIGCNAVQGACHAGAKYVVVIDPLQNKREMALKLGATHAFASADEACAAIIELTRGQGADAAILTPGVMTAEIVGQGFTAVGKGGVIVLTAMGKLMDMTVTLPGVPLSVFRKQIAGSLLGDCNPTYDIPMLLRLYQAGRLKLDELITRRYSLDEVNDGYGDLLAGSNIRGVIELAGAGVNGSR